MVRGGQPIREEDVQPSAASAAPALTLDEETREREAALEALRLSGGNRDAAARRLGISVRTLYYRLRRWGLN